MKYAFYIVMCQDISEATQMLVIVDYVKEMAVKKSCKYVEYELFEHLLFLFCCFMKCGHKIWSIGGEERKGVRSPLVSVLILSDIVPGIKTWI